VLDDENLLLKTALLEIAKTGKANFRFTTNQHLILSDIKETDKKLINDILEKYQILAHNENASPLRKNSMACVAFNTCPLALAEGQRYLPHLVTKIEALLGKYALEKEEIIIRMTGCPNGCARSYIAEIGFVGTAYGKYNLQLGGDYEGRRLNKIYKENLDESQILSELDTVLDSFKKERKGKERFGDYTWRKFFAS
jgi:sulfite reductase (NADPH) hemoprotein beta-component